MVAFSWFEVIILIVSSEVCFLVDLGKKMIPGSVVGCVENNINTMLFVRFHFFTSLVSFLGTLDSLFLIFEGLGSRSGNR